MSSYPLSLLRSPILFSFAVFSFSLLFLVSHLSMSLIDCRYASAVGKEQRMKGTNIMLGPMVNVLRVPMSGRSYEGYEEKGGEQAQAKVRRESGAGEQARGGKAKGEQVKGERARQESVMQESVRPESGVKGE
jgi:hypothetical protein